MSSPTSETTKRSLDLSDSNSLSPDFSESPSISEPGPDRIHFKVYRVQDNEKRKYVGRCWTVDARTAAIKLGTRGLPRVDCSAMVSVEGVEPGQAPEQFRVRQFFGEITPLTEAKYAERGTLSPDGRMKYKEIVSDEPVREPTSTRVSPPVSQSTFRHKPVPLPASKLMMVPVWVQVPQGLGYSNPWSQPTIVPTPPSTTNNAAVARAARPKAAIQAKPSAARAPRVPAQRPTMNWHLNPTERYARGQQV